MSATLRVHFGDDVWFADDMSRAPRSCPNIPSFLRLLGEIQVDRVRVLGSARNAPLIIALHREATSQRFSLQVSSPRVCSRADFSNPEIVLHRMQSVAGPASTGGWHEVSEADVASYALANSVLEAKGIATADAVALLPRHPTWQAISFLPTAQQSYAALLLSAIVDPRWFIDPGSPSKLSRLYEFLGLSKRNFELLHSGHVPSDPSAHHGFSAAGIAYMAWSGNAKLAKDEIGKPANFLWRVMKSFGGAARGKRMATQLFIKFLRGVWIDGLTSIGHEPLFVPKYFFQNEDEVSAFQAHCAPPLTTG